MVEPLPAWARALVAAVAVLAVAAVAASFWPGGGSDGWVDVTVQGAFVSEDGQELLVNLDACTQDGRVTLTAEGPLEVRLRSEALDPSETEDCGYSDKVRLDSPLAGRRVVDDVSGETVIARESP